MLNKLFFVILVTTFVFNLCISLLIFGLVSKYSRSKNDKNFKPAINTSQRKTDRSEILFGGDVMLGRSVNKRGIESGDFTYPFSKISDITKKADLFIVNLESPLVYNCPIITSGYTFCADPKMITALTYGGVDIVSLANNHTRNFGEKGLDDTKQILEKNGILYTGLGNVVYKMVNDLNFGFLGFDFTVLDIKDSERELIKRTNENCEVLIAIVHWGDEYKNVPNQKQKILAQDLVESGVDIIIGTHPHWIQKAEYVLSKDGLEKPVFYSLGNLVFDQMWSEETKKGELVKLIFEGEKVLDYEVIPVYISEIGEPQIY